MAVGGNSAYSDVGGLAPLVESAVGLAASLGFDHSCAPEQGQLLSVLARGWRGGRIGETGTGCGVGLAWMVEATDPTTSFVSIELDHGRASAAAELFADHPHVRVEQGDWRGLVEYGPFDLLVLDGGGKGKDPSVDSPLDPAAGWLAVGGTVVLDDFIPAGAPGAAEHDAARRHWLEHPLLSGTEIRLSPTLATIVAVRVR
ncbi:class I SAM-dependent methyltransferase [Streptomyces sp. NL15-2K]|uniref:O-methyltransferase n=1 Tax=Streptomyces sp. NL15-2K TaxID=376149 RepID=UPI0026F233EE|nr:class I SAM-dependent methyltransferase [Kutzneria buriramensis]WKX15860.1 class I SAM-dependent methyltransferase [Kutzneria buriramensis]